MSTFSKIYHSPKDPNLSLSVTWETGYRNIQVFHKDRLVHTIKQPAVLVDGIKIKDEELGTLKFSFSIARPRKLEIKVNNRKYKTINKLDLGYDYTGLVATFSSLAVFAAMEAFMLGGFYDFDFSIFEFKMLFIIDIVIVALYGTTSYLLSKRKAWSYFMGTSMFMLTSFFAITTFLLMTSSLMDIVLLVLRLGILTYILLQIKHILKEMKRPKQDDSLIDSI